MEDEHHPFTRSNLQYDKIIEDKRAQTYVFGPKFEDLVPITSSSPHTHFNYL